MDEISAKEDLITPERLAKGDLLVAFNSRGKIKHAIPARLTIIKELVRREVFPYHYEIYGVGFLELMNAFRSPWTVRSSAVLLEQFGVGVSASRAGEIYQNVCRGIGKQKAAVVYYVLTEDKEKEQREKHKVYCESFELLTEVMDAEREKIHAALFIE